MYKEILSILRCPKCHKRLEVRVNKQDDEEIIEGMLSCKEGHSWKVKEGVIDFVALEQDKVNNWSEYDYVEMDQKILQGTPQNQREINEKAKRTIINSVNDIESEFILDIATGRGMLFTDMLRNLEEKSQILCTDLSFEVLKYDRLKAKKINPKFKVNYIACDGTNLPLKDNSVDIATSFFGIANMLYLTSDGVKEAHRVLKEGQSLFNTFITIKEDSKGFKILKELYEDNNIMGVDNFVLETVIEKAHSEAKFKEIEIITIGESVGEKSEFDLIPFEGEWFSVILVKGIK